MTGPFDGRDESMDFKEGALKERFENAVSGLSPDVGALLEGGLRRGAQLHRRRRTQAFGAAALSAAVAAGLYAGVASGLFDPNSTGPADTTNSIVEQVDRRATTRALTAVALEHLQPDRLTRADAFSTGVRDGSLQVLLVLGTEHGKAHLELDASRHLDGLDKGPQCGTKVGGAKTDQCSASTLPNGDRLVVTTERFTDRSGSATYLVAVAVVRDGQAVDVQEYLTGSQLPKDETQPVADWKLPVSVAEMRAIVTDPRYGLETSREMIATGAALDNFKVHNK